MKSRPALLFPTLFLTFALPGAAWAQTTWYVGEPASGAGVGSEKDPFNSISYALQKIESGDTVLVQPGTYEGAVQLSVAFDEETFILSEEPYQARLRHTAQVIAAYTGRNITIEGFDIAHSGETDGEHVVYLRDSINDPKGEKFVGGITLRDNIIHDSYDGSLVCVSGGAGDVLLEGNLFYNQPSETAQVLVDGVSDVSVVGNVFMNDYASSGRSVSDSHSFLQVADSNGASDKIEGASDIYVGRNIFLNWHGSEEHFFLQVGGHGNSAREADGVTIENNLMLGNSSELIRAALGINGAKDVVFRNNTVVGDMPGHTYAARIAMDGLNDENEEIVFYNNVWSDPVGTMGAEDDWDVNDFCDAATDETLSFELHANLYFNGGEAIPDENLELLRYTEDKGAVTSDPLLGDQSKLILPSWSADDAVFADGSTTIDDVFLALANSYGCPDAGSPVLDMGEAANAPEDDIFGTARDSGSAPDLGACEGGWADLEITTTELEDGVEGEYYTGVINASGGMEPYAWELLSGILPEGLTLGSASGVITGTARQVEQTEFEVQVTDSSGTPKTASAAFSLNVTSGDTGYIDETYTDCGCHAGSSKAWPWALLGFWGLLVVPWLRRGRRGS